ncbi:MAG TPA: hypothetical protein VKU01_23300 [Bryobacteraceae bacterium]|nr:hypothetical protein [Bryobacteraceae bacterium]
MTLEAFTKMQRDDGRRGLSSLLQDCVRRFLAAASLVGAEGPAIKRIQDARYEGNVDLTPLFPIWDLICERYRKERFDAQASLFKEHSQDVLERWGQFLHWELSPLFLRENEFVRNVLRAVDLLPCRSREQVVSAMYQYISDMSLPYQRPPWDSADIE